MNLAHVIASTAPKHPRSPALQDGDADLLPLSGTTPFTVSVKIGTSTLEFSQNGGPSYPDGLSWDAPKGTPQATITFDFGSPTITSLSSSTAGLSFQAPSGSQQVGTVDRPPTAPKTYDFTVITSTGNRNGKIVVTPIGDPGDDG
jgi:hypothetical protein